VKYLLMIYGNQEKWESMPADEWPDAIARQEAFNAKYRETGDCAAPTRSAVRAPCTCAMRSAEPSRGLVGQREGPRSRWRPVDADVAER
jgi:hypothetical protein